MSDGPQNRSENVNRDETGPDPNKRQKAQLVVGDAPKKPMGAGKGLESNTAYQKTGIALSSLVICNNILHAAHKRQMRAT